MKRNYLCVIGTVFCIAAIVTDAGAVARAAAEETEILTITVGQPTKLSNVVYTNMASVAVSRTGVVAAFYPKRGTGPNFLPDVDRSWQNMG